MNNENKFLGQERDLKSQQVLDTCSSKLNELSKIGARILLNEVPEGTLLGDYLMPAMLFIRNQIEIIEAISVLVRDGLTSPCLPLLRVLFETQLQLEYILEKDQEQRGLSFMVWHTYESISIYEKTDGQSHRYKQLQAAFAKDRFAKDLSPLIIQDAQSRIDNANNLLKKKKYSPINEEYLRYKRDKKKNAQYWYSLFGGPESVQGLASYCQLDASYETIYRSWSDSAHGTEIMRGIISADENGYVQVNQIRDIKRVRAVTLHSFNLFMFSLNVYVRKRLPDLTKEFQSWYLELKPFHDSLSTSKKSQDH